VGFPQDLEEFSEEQLIKELNRRYDLRERGLCDYCEQPTAADPCRFPERHTLLEKTRDSDRRLSFAQRLASMVGKKLTNRRIRKRS